MHSGKNSFDEECERRAGGINIDWIRESRDWNFRGEESVDFLLIHHSNAEADLFRPLSYLLSLILSSACMAWQSST